MVTRIGNLANYKTHVKGECEYDEETEYYLFQIHSGLTIIELTALHFYLVSALYVSIERVARTGMVHVAGCAANTLNGAPYISI